MVQGMGVPCPTVMTILCIIDIVAGSVLYLTCAAALYRLSLNSAGIPVLMEWGAEFLLIFLKLGESMAIAQSARILASYYGHYKPWKESKEEFHVDMLMKNAALMGQCLLTVGFEVPEIGKDGTPLGLGGRLGKFGDVTGDIYGLSTEM